MAQQPGWEEVDRPYKGADSYQIEDADLFFGRDAEAAHLLAQILSSRYTLLYAQSGAGKTSLLNARIIPGLERQGWSAVRVRPEEDPVEAVRRAVLVTLLPAPASEALTLHQAFTLLGDGDPTLPLAQLLERHAALPVQHTARRRLLAPVEIATPSGATAQVSKRPIHSRFQRLLNGGVSARDYLHYLAMVGRAAGDGLEAASLEETVTVGELLDWIEGDLFAAGHATLLENLDPPLPGLENFFHNLFDLLEAHFFQARLVLILDQFEELFTRFADIGPLAIETETKSLDWRLREELFCELTQLHTARLPPPAGEEANIEGPFLPIRYVVSIRSDYVAELNRIGHLATFFQANSYHLFFLEEAAARAAIEEPARRYGYGYEQPCFDALLRQLLREERYVMPAHLQIVCEKLWNERGQELARRGSEETLPVIGYAVFEGLGGVEGILRAFFHEYLDDLEKGLRVEVLEMLELLITASGTRNIVARDHIVHAPFVQSELRADLLKKLADQRLVQIQERLGGQFVEITHEFLIQPIRDAIQEHLTQNAGYWRYRIALQLLQRLERMDLATDSELHLRREECHSLHDYRKRVCWTDAATELMFRSALVCGMHREILRHWADAVAASPQDLSLDTLLQRLNRRSEEARTLSFEELRILYERRKEIPAGCSLRELILHSALRRAGDSESEWVRYWAREAAEDE